MPICPKCGKKIKGANKIKIKGVWRHHHLVKKKDVDVVLKPRSEGMSTMVMEKVKSRGIEMKNTKLSDEQLMRRAIESGQIK